MSIRIGIAGISGRMGIFLAQEAAAAATLVGGISRSGAGLAGTPHFPDITTLAQESDVVIDFTHASTVHAHALALAETETPWVLGTTGYGTEDEAAIRAAARTIPIIAAPNFCTGVNLLLLLAEKLGHALPASQYDAEIVEMHHRQKVDAPSGTALAIGQAVAAGRSVDLADVIVSGRDGHTGPRKDGEIGFATLRGGQIVGSHTLLFTAGDEQISLTHHAFDRRVFASGAVRAALWLHAQPAGLYGMRDFLRL
ncbi:4-hydroxy-tetrahydrodipicolinate reductase [Acidocella sp.]|uniref:4-hydroxy-tetrahydrodipicolinate reductase n=1 Tax=Acidocella sp. TaxID=50710 RepID=UPI00261D4A70|nr:4-hydroxy-tetrahydrodipicolinate reductase [Acidocella sp.]